MRCPDCAGTGEADSIFALCPACAGTGVYVVLPPLSRDPGLDVCGECGGPIRDEQALCDPCVEAVRAEWAADEDVARWDIY